MRAGPHPVGYENLARDMRCMMAENIALTQRTFQT